MEISAPELRPQPWRASTLVFCAVGLLGPLRMDYEKAIRSVRAAAFELSRLAEDVYGSS